VIPHLSNVLRLSYTIYFVGAIGRLLYLGIKIILDFLSGIIFLIQDILMLMVLYLIDCFTGFKSLKVQKPANRALDIITSFTVSKSLKVQKR